MVPLMALASRESLAGTKLSLPPSLFTLTSALAATASWPPAPLTLIWSSLMDTSTPAGTVTGIFPTRDISSLLPLSDVAQHFATDSGSTCFAVSHHTLGGGDDGHAQAIHDLRNGVATLVHAQARTAHTLDALDDRATGVVLQGDFQLGLAVRGLDLEAVDITFVLQHLGDGHLHLGRGHRHAGLGDHLGVTDAGQQIGDGITHAHVVSLLPIYQLALVTPGILPSKASSRILARPRPN